MQELFQKYLFNKSILVNDSGAVSGDALATELSLAALFGVRIREGHALAEPGMIRFLSQQLGEQVPEPFYRGFPESVLQLSPEMRLLDQLIHYATSMGEDLYGPAGHSVLEEVLERTPFRENVEVKDFTILSGGDARALLVEYVEDLLRSTRPLSMEQYDFVRAYFQDDPAGICHCASKNTAIQLLLDLRELSLARFLALSDVIKVVEALNHSQYDDASLRKLNLRNRDRKFLTALIYTLFRLRHADVRNCYEKKDLWCGLLHHLHFRPQDGSQEEFVRAMRSPGNRSVYSAFERAMADGDIRGAVTALYRGKGGAAVLRNLNYIVSRCKTPEDVQFVMEHTDTRNVIVLLQLLLQYEKHPGKAEKRTFKFTKFHLLRVHSETPVEQGKRRSWLNDQQRAFVTQALLAQLARVLHGRLGKVYIDPQMRRIALPLQETTAQGGYGVMPRGSRIPLPEGKKVRAFTYWEGVPDIDLSAIGLSRSWPPEEFSWRTIWNTSSGSIVFSGDERRGEQGGSEYFDIEPDQFCRDYPDVEYLVFCNNVFTGSSFADCVCRAGYMLRDQMDSGEIYEPRTVRSSFPINCESTSAYLFAIDLKTKDFVWLNMAKSGNDRVAGTSDHEFLMDLLNMGRFLNVYVFFEMLATELVASPEEAEVIVSDQPLESVPQGAEVIRSHNTERILALMNG